MLVGCDRYVPPSLVVKSADLCEHNDGIVFMVMEGWSASVNKTTAIVKCGNGATFYLYQKGPSLLSPYVLYGE